MATRNMILCQLAIKSLRMFADKAKRLKHDPILSRMLYSESTIFDQNGDFIIIEDNEELKFFKV